MASQESLFDGPSGLFDVKEQNRLESIVEFIYERHKVFLKKNVLKREAPWTKDPFLQSYRFCNIYREIDTVSLWIHDNIIVPYEKNPNLWFMLCIARLINWPDTLQEMMDKGVWPVKKWDPDAVYKVLKGRANRKEKLITGAYIVNSVIPKSHKTEDTSKAYYIPHVGLDPLWKARTELYPKMRDTMEGAVEALRQHQGWGAFMAYQVIVDLSYSLEWLGNAEDYNTYTSPGPGTTRGMNRLMYGGKKGGKKPHELNEPMRIALAKVNVLLRERVARAGDRWWTDDFKTGYQELSMSNFSNANCEYDKYCRLLGNEGEPRSRYNGKG
jgi:hypothetical protein